MLQHHCHGIAGGMGSYEGLALVCRSGSRSNTVVALLHWKGGRDNHRMTMENPTANGNIPNHTANHISADKNGILDGMMTPNHSLDMKSSGEKHSNSENKHSVSKDKTHSSSKHHHSSSSKHSSSSSKHHHSSSGSRSDGKHHSSSKDGKHHSSSSKDGKHHSSSSSKHHSSSSSKDPSKSQSSSGSSSHRSQSSKDPSKHHSSSSKDPSKSSHSSSSSIKHHSSSSKHKDGHSSSHKHKDGSSSGSKHSAENAIRSNDSLSSMSPDQFKPDSFGIMVKAELMKVEPKVEISSPTKEPVLSPIRIKIKHEVADNSDDDVPLSARLNKVKSEPAAVKRLVESDDEEPLSKKLQKVKILKKENEQKRGKKHKRVEDDDFQPEKKKKKLTPKPPIKQEVTTGNKRAAKKKEEEQTKWKWWEEEKEDDGVKWKFLEHRGPLLAPPYEGLPSSIKFYYNGQVMRLEEPAEEVATFYGRMLDHDYTTKEVFNRNFFKDWRKVMTPAEREIITDLKLCDFREIMVYFKEQSEKKKAMSKEEKQVIKAQNENIVEEYGWCDIDGHKQRIGNFRVEPPGLFRGRGNHPKQGMLKKRTLPEDIIVNCSKDSKYPQPPPGRKWKEVRHDNTVTWLACWVENIQGSTKYVMLNAASKLKGEKDFKKYEMARNLHKVVDRIRAQYREDWKSKEMRVRQRAVAMYFIDKLALRAGNEKDEDQADTVGCCSLRVEHITLHEKYEDKEEFVVEFDFLGKDSIRYYNRVPVEKRVFKNLQLFKENKSEGDDLFDRLTTTSLNKYLQGLMDGLTAKVFRTYNASKTLQEQLDLLTNADDPLPAKLLSYNRANRAVAVLCNHQRAVPKNFSKQMENLQTKIDAKRDAVQDAKREVKKAKADYKAQKTETARKALERRKKALERLEMQLTKLEVQQTDKDENKEIALGTSKLNYLDPRISVAWCKKWDVPIEKIYNKTQREKFAWAIDMTEEDYRF
ncbi:hypothetical protein LSH36_112g05100 [Paralvinella palmiformis]|uniref:DNA topoisomerase I n=1 Tax=Paralvinella palmiformis TaxID=53620 RepID=A0AAD9JZA8_9ANNE|nr:hypothetical protein LSH36_112g05100 [Paralvinella palmiformis]